MDKKIIPTLLGSTPCKCSLCDNRPATATMSGNIKLYRNTPIGMVLLDRFPLPFCESPRCWADATQTVTEMGSRIAGSFVESGLAEEVL